MREIRFRVWDNVDYMSTPFYLNDIQEGKIQFTTDCVVMQFTGVKDKNGKEVFEGDIVMFLDRDWADFEKDTKRFPVVYENDAFILKDAKPNKYGEFYSYPLFKDYGRDRFEVIGNIHENPELIESKHT